jgi:hypothetical protein
LGVGPCDVPFRYASEPIPRYRGTVARWHDHLRGLATAIHEISGLGERGIFMDEGGVVEEGTVEHFFNNPNGERTKLFLSQIL